MTAFAPIGILGGTFDPIHYGHLRLGQQVGEALKLSEVRFVPSGTPPHRAAPRLPPGERLAMVKLAVRDNCLFNVDERESLRSGPAYTVDTLAELREELGRERSARLASLLPAPRTRMPDQMGRYSNIITGRMRQMGW